MSEEDTPVQTPNRLSDDISQVIRRKDLVALGDTFKSALAPVTTLVSSIRKQNDQTALILTCMEGQTRRMDRMQRWFFYLAAIVALGVLVYVVTLMSIFEVIFKQSLFGWIK